MTAEQLFISNLSLIERIVASIGRRYRLGPADLADLASIVNLKLIENDYAVLRQHEGRSALSTYLFVVVQRCYYAYRDQEGGRWRPSAEASRMGETAVALERLLHRDGFSYSEAAGQLLDRNPQLTAEELDALYARLPNRPPRSKGDGDAALTYLPSSVSADERLVDGELSATSERIRSALGAVLRDADAEERTILRLRFVEGMRPATIASLLNADVRKVYKRLELLLRRLRRALLAAGIDATAAGRLIERPSIPLDFSLEEGGIGAWKTSQKVRSEVTERSVSGE
jgi:RNA polymerase sigma factor (sigma-70 family)